MKVDSQFINLLMKFSMHVISLIPFFCSLIYLLGHRKEDRKSSKILAIITGIAAALALLAQTLYVNADIKIMKINELYCCLPIIFLPILVLAMFMEKKTNVLYKIILVAGVFGFLVMTTNGALTMEHFCF